MNIIKASVHSDYKHPACEQLHLQICDVSFECLEKFQPQEHMKTKQTNQ